MATAVSLVPAVSALGEPITGINTEVDISAGGNAPVIKAKWEQDMTQDLENGDAGHFIGNQPGHGPNAQFLPPGVYQGKKPYQLFSVVEDEEEMGDVLSASFDVYHPDGSFKYQVMAVKIDDVVAGKAYLEDAYTAGLVTINPDYDYAHIVHQVEQGLAKVWVADAELDYEQMSGTYRVEATAQDVNNNIAVPLINFFDYVAVSCIEIDFNAINYGAVSVGTYKQVGGDTTWNSPAVTNQATVRTIGNTNSFVTVMQDDMGFGYSGVNGDIPNVEYQARLGATGTLSSYVPHETVQLVEMVPHSSVEKLDFYILVNKGSGVHTGTMTIGTLISPGFYWPNQLDSDSDGLTDVDEFIYGTDWMNPDTDGDGLTDGEEVNTYGTDPLNPDTDDGGISDGHEVLVDGTDPLDGSDDMTGP